MYDGVVVESLDTFDQGSKFFFFFFFFLKAIINLSTTLNPYSLPAVSHCVYPPKATPKSKRVSFFGGTYS